MRYIYRIKPIDKEELTIEAMSYKKMLRSLVLKFPDQTIICFYKNKKGRDIKKLIDTSKIKQKG